MEGPGALGGGGRGRAGRRCVRVSRAGPTLPRARVAAWSGEEGTGAVPAAAVAMWPKLAAAYPWEGLRSVLALGGRSV